MKCREIVIRPDRSPPLSPPPPSGSGLVWLLAHLSPAQSPLHSSWSVLKAGMKKVRTPACWSCSCSPASEGQGDEPARQLRFPQRDPSSEVR